MGLDVIDLKDAFLTDEKRLVQVISVNAQELLCEDSSSGTLETIRVVDVGKRWRRVLASPDA